MPLGLDKLSFGASQRGRWADRRPIKTSPLLVAGSGQVPLGRPPWEVGYYVPLAIRELLDEPPFPCG
eukprot:7208184-Alexandrium_andersonii.AAC.1